MNRELSNICNNAAKIVSKELQTNTEIREIKLKRLIIPNEVRSAVWKRDEGRCRNCNSVIDLEYDHIIPASKGGSNSHRNIELLCRKCNKTKRDKNI